MLQPSSEHTLCNLDEPVLPVQEGARFGKKNLKLIVVDPMASFRNSDDTVVADGVDAGIILRYRCKAFQAPKDQRWGGDLAVEFHSI